MKYTEPSKFKKIAVPAFAGIAVVACIVMGAVGVILPDNQDLFLQLFTTSMISFMLMMFLAA